LSHSVAVLGASGYAGGELVRLLDRHPFFAVAHLGARTNAGRSLGEVHPHLSGGERVLGSIDPEAVGQVDLAFLALPHGASARVAPELLERGVRVVDLGSDYRLDTPQRYQSAYTEPHPFPDRLGEWPYGLPELFGDVLLVAPGVAAPGCYPTAAVLGLAPLLAARLIQPTGIVVNAVSGVSGAGRSLREDLLFGAIDENVGAYAVGRHRHRPEIEMALELASGIPRVSVTFTPHLVPMQRGILSTATAVLAEPAERSELMEVLQTAYREATFVDVIDDSPQTRWVVGSNRAIVTAYVDESTGRAIVLTAIDNLIKGAAGQAIQVANLMLGVDESAGLPLDGWMP
jgi:N-acetyl-gamma-glutamyl-phosphate reductase